MASVDGISFSFKGEPGNPEGDRRHIQFNFETHSDGRTWLRVYAAGPGAGVATRVGFRDFNRINARLTWTTLAENLRGAI